MVKRILTILFSVCMLTTVLNGCGHINNNTVMNTSDNTSVSDAQELLIHKITEFPVPRTDIEEQREVEDGKANIILDEAISGNTLYRLEKRWIYDERYGLELDTYFVRKLEYPYVEWETFQSTYMNLEGDYKADDVRCGYRPITIVRIEDEKLYFLAVGLNSENREMLALGSFDVEDGFRIITPIQVSLNDNQDSYYNYKALYDGDTNVYLYHGFYKTRGITKYNTVTGISEKYSSGLFTDMIIESFDGEKPIRYGNDKEGFSVSYLGDGGELLNDLAMDEYIYDVISTKDGFLLASITGVWTCGLDGKIEKKVDFIEQGYRLKDIKDVATWGDCLSVLATLDGRDYILQIDITQMVPDDRKKVVVCTTVEIPILEYYIAKFNRQNSNYRVVTEGVQEGEEWDFNKFCDDLRVSISTGKGPDILMTGILDLEDLAKNGYIIPLEDIIEDETKYLDAAMEYGMYEGKRYGVPYEFYLSAVAYSKDTVGDRDKISLEEFERLLKESNANTIARDCSAYDVVMEYGLSDNTNTCFIDWGTRESHLEDQAFIDLISLAKEYCDKGDINNNNFADKLKNHEVFSEKIFINDIDMMNYLKACFSGKEACLGFPREDGNGLYIYANMLYINRNSKVSEGAKEFLKFIISEENQLLLAEDLFLSPDEMNISGQLPVSKKALAECFKLAASTESEKGLSMWHGITYDTGVYTEESIEKVEVMLDKAHPANFKIYSIADIVSEELDPYFKGARSAEETARILDSRVQLYLDENE